MQEDSNGESFEIIDRKATTGDKSEITDSLSSISSAYSITSPVPSGGNLLSNVPPPTTLPDLTLWTTQPQLMKPIPSAATQFPATQFSAAIPPSKGLQQQPSQDAEASATGGLMGFVKEAFATGGVLSKMAEKAKNSVDSIITTLDPQMSEFIYSGGDTVVTVASDNEEEVAGVREAFHNVFGKAWVNGIQLDLPKKTMPVGLEAGWRAVTEKLEQSLKIRKTPTIAIEGVLYQVEGDWYNINLLMLKDNDRRITVKMLSQTTPILDIDKALDTGDKIAAYLQTKENWQQTVTGLSQKDILSMASKALIRIYKNKLQN